MKLKTLFAVAFMAVGFSHSAFADLNIVTDRSKHRLEQVFKDFEEDTGIKVNSAFVGKGLIARLENWKGDTDIAITKNASVMEIASRKGLLKKMPNSITNNITMSDPEGFWSPVSYRARVMYYSPSRVDVNSLNGYLDLADPSMKGKVCIRDLKHNYNISLVSSMMIKYGEDKTQEWLNGVVDNFARKPSGNDRKQLKAVYEGKCDVAVANTYYMALMMSRNDQRDWATGSRIFFPDQKNDGSFVLFSALGVTKDVNPEMQKFLDYIYSPRVQRQIANTGWEYPMVGNTTSAMTKSFGEGQPGLKNGIEFVRYFTNPSDIADRRNKALSMIDKALDR